MADSRALLAALKRKREKLVDLGGGKKVWFLRPTESDMGDLLTGQGETRFWKIGAEHVCKFVHRWDGFTEADVLGADLAPPDPVEFDPDLWAELSGDRIEWTTKVADEILKSVVSHINERAAIAKNSEPA